MKKYKRVVLLILDGWGISPSWGGNALAVNQPRNINRLWRDYPHKVLQAFTLVAGKYGVVGDSRLGHSTIAAGRRIPQDLEVISESIANRSFYKNKVLINAIEHAQKNNSALHLVGLLSNGGIHAHLSHLEVLLELCHRQNFTNVYIDAITDGIDSGELDALSFIEKINQKIKSLGFGKFSSVIGRDYAMDRIGDIVKTQTAYDLMVKGLGDKTETVTQAITRGYQKKETDFNLSPTIILNDGQAKPIDNNDSVIFFNFRSDRMTQFLKLFLGLEKHKLFWAPREFANLEVVTLTNYEDNLPVKVAYPKSEVKDTLGEVLANYKEKQLRIAEEEKASHVTDFFNCGKKMFPLQETKIIKSKRTLDPEMQTPKIADYLIKTIKSANYDFILANFANVDMMSHTGNMQAAGVAIGVVDKSVQKVVEANLTAGGITIITADHGNIEQMVKLKAQEDPETKHTLNPVPFIIITPDNKKNLIKSAVTSEFFSLSKIMSAEDSLADIAPTVLELMEIPKPETMTGHSLLNRLE